MIPVAEGLFAVADDGLPRLLGSRCADCGVITFPAQPSCPACAGMAVAALPLTRTGTLWTWTIQSFIPKSPPYPVTDPGTFQPYGVGYIELPGQVRVESRLTVADPAELRIGMPMELVLVPAPGADPGVVTFAFRPVPDE